MTIPPGVDITEALELTRSYHHLRQQIDKLKQLSVLCCQQAALRRDAFRTKVEYHKDPTQLAHAFDLFARADSDAKSLIQWEYQNLLKLMHKHPATGVENINVDFAALPPVAKPFLLAPFLDIFIGGVYPRLCFDQTNLSTGKLVYIITGGHADADQWRAQLPIIREWLGDHYSLTDATASTITLTRQQALPKIIPYDDQMLKPGALFVGFDTTTQKPAYIDFADLSSGTYIPGTAGSGKTNAQHILLQSIFSNLDLFTEVYLVDGKDGVAFSRYRDTNPDKVKVLFDEADLWALTQRLTTTMRERNVQQREAGIDNATRDFIAVVIDEMATYTAKPSSDAKSEANKKHTAFLDDLAKLAGRGRSTGLRLIITSQRPVKEQMPMTVRANCQSLMCFRLNNTTDTTMVFEEIEADADPRKLKKGQALLRDAEGETRHVQFPLAPHHAT